MAIVALLSACATAQNYPDTTGPRYHGEFAGQALLPTLKLVTLNLKYAQNVAGAILLLRQSDALRNADVITLQEMDDAGAGAIAKALSLNGTPMPNTNRVFKLNWATGGGLADRR